MKTFPQLLQDQCVLIISFGILNRYTLLFMAQLIIAFWHNTDWNIHPLAQCKIDHWWGKEAAFLKSGLILLFPVRVTFVSQIMFSITLCACRTPPSSPGHPGSCRLLTRSSLQKQNEQCCNIITILSLVCQTHFQMAIFDALIYLE